MTEMMNTILKAILSACGGALFAGICVWVKGLYTKNKVYDEVLKALAHDAYFRYCSYLLPEKELTEAEVENFNFLYKAYHSLGLNSTGDKLYNQIIAKPVKASTK